MIRKNAYNCYKEYEKLLFKIKQTRLFDIKIGDYTLMIHINNYHLKGVFVGKSELLAPSVFDVKKIINQYPDLEEQLKTRSLIPETKKAIITLFIEDLKTCSNDQLFIEKIEQAVDKHFTETTLSTLSNRLN